ncbi:hypothetical protein GCM10009606_39740 [Nocardioides aquiterrae]|uniref:Uncharacterized protein n=1 Tax=Nocardioides aquiterrae TaxID=203799 RepID=A0ABN1ULM4_9ACTN
MRPFQQMERVLASDFVAGYVREDITEDEIERQRALYGPFTEAVRDLVDATIRTEVDEHEVRAVQAEVEALTARLRRRQHEGPYGVRFSSDGRAGPGATRSWGCGTPPRRRSSSSATRPGGRGRASTSAPRSRARPAWCTAGSRR